MRIYTPATALSLAVVLSTGCGKKDADTGDTDDTADQDQDQTVEEIFEGLGYWFLELTRDEDRDVNNTECDENFSDAECEDDGAEGGDTDWTYTGSYEESPGATVAQILKGKDGAYYLYWDGYIFPGEKVGGSDGDDTDASLRAGSAEFEFGWWGSSTSTNGSEHYTGYEWDYSEAEGGGYNFKLTLDLDNGTVEGEFDQTYERTREWSESDEWESQARGTYGQLPSSSYLEHSDGGEGGNVYNTRTEDDCSGPKCTITITQQNRVAYEVSGNFLSSDDGEGIDEDIEGLGWNSGVPND